MKHIVLTLFLLSSILSLRAFDISAPRLSNASDTVRAAEILKSPDMSADDYGHNIAVAAKSLLGAGADSYYNTDSTADIRLNLQAFTPLSFINSALALGQASLANTNPGWRDFAKAFVALSCRRGEDKGFNSIMYHTSDWINDNIYRGNVKERTEDFSGAVSKTKSLTYLTRNRDKFAALADSAMFENVKFTEMGFRSMRVPMLKKETISKKEVLSEIKDGDIIIMVCNGDGIDYYRIGVAVNKEDGPYMIMFDPEEGKVIETPTPLPLFFKTRTKHYSGYRLLRPVR